MAMSMTPLIREKEFGFIEVKCPFVQRDFSPLEASLTSGFCCRQVILLS